MAFRFEALNVWQKAVDTSNEIDPITKRFPVEERYSLSSQLKKAADAVVLNIVEGATGQTVPVFKQFLNIALRPAIEVVAGLFLAKKGNYIPEDLFKKLYEEYELLSKMITRLRNAL
ncbi:four helix bundle protein [Niabella drilacis]|uniref:Four helix bundle protein n=1 Tax=Niabella drilacis (strain DSM 25811 / CCM 8410 / CCUG 62505 / LMG 26954 / E90) TaxID=1285928 RepID=A0A1G6ZUZ6_NIADE|nr:four helix bundle protein [Niabella drilacis]SDE05406.1 four helix bundle protein [Niabella drilacis]